MTSYPNSMRHLGLGVVCLVSAAGWATAQSSSSGANAPRTSWGAPDLQGVWDVRTATPLQRPADLAGKPVLTDEEAAEYETRAQQRRVQRRDRSVEHRDGLSEVDPGFLCRLSGEPGSVWLHAASIR